MPRQATGHIEPDEIGAWKRAHRRPQELGLGTVAPGPHPHGQVRSLPPLSAGGDRTLDRGARGRRQVVMARSMRSAQLEPLISQGDFPFVGQLCESRLLVLV